MTKEVVTISKQIVLGKEFEIYGDFENPLFFGEGRSHLARKHRMFRRCYQKLMTTKRVSVMYIPLVEIRTLYFLGSC